jgi:hypothetical protein
MSRTIDSEVAAVVVADAADFPSTADDDFDDDDIFISLAVFASLRLQNILGVFIVQLLLLMVAQQSQTHSFVFYVTD